MSAPKDPPEVEAAWIISAALGSFRNPRTSAGNTSSPAFLEGIAMALAGTHLRQPIGPAISECAAGLHAIAAAIEAHGEAIADAINDHAKHVSMAGQGIASNVLIHGKDVSTGLEIVAEAIRYASDSAPRTIVRSKHKKSP